MGEALFLRDGWPESPLSVIRVYYNARGFDFDFDDELQGPLMGVVAVAYEECQSATRGQ